MLKLALLFLVAFACVRSRRVEGLVKAERATRDEVLPALRARGRAEIEGAGAVVVETDGSMSVLDARPGRAAHPKLFARS